MNIADDISKAYHEGYKQGRFDAIADIPHGVEKGYSVVAVVRCRDCAHGRYDEDSEMYDCGYVGLAIYNEPNHYCSHGEKKEK